MISGGVAAAITAWTPRELSGEVVAFAKEVVAAAEPASVARAKALLFAASRLGAFAEGVGLELCPEAVLHPSVIERLVLLGATAMSAATRRTVRTNSRFLAARVGPGAGRPAAVCLPRERAKAPYDRPEIAAYLALADAQPTRARAMRAAGLVCLAAGAGLVGSDLRGVVGSDIVARSGGLLVEVRGSRPRTVPVLAAYHDRLGEVGAFFAGGFVVGGADPLRRNVTSGLIASLSGGADLPRIDIGRLRSTWLAAVAEAIGLRGLMDAAGITCSQRLGDIVATLPALGEETAVALLGGTP